MKVVVVGGFILLILFSMFPTVMNYVFWGVAAAIFLIIIIASPRDSLARPEKKKKVDKM